MSTQYLEMGDKSLVHDEHQEIRSARKQITVSIIVFMVTLAALLGLAIASLVIVAGNNHLLHKIDKATRHSSALSAIPSSYAVPHVPPRKSQDLRGTCWDFTTVAVVEHQYRLQGLDSGKLKATDSQVPYVSFSEQAYGIAVVQMCATNPKLCITSGDDVGFNSTEGGEVPLLYYAYRKFGAHLMFPTALCPYTDEGHQFDCPGFPATADDWNKNPVSFKIQNHESYYDIDVIKKALFAKKHAMGFSVSMHITNYYQPCSVTNSTTLRSCGSSGCQPCPANKNLGSACCLQATKAMYNMDGEFFAHHEMVLEGGHAMTLVGYNDNYRTREGYTGGFIVRNSWKDGLLPYPQGPRGSHSIQWFMKNISEVDERVMCPNAYNPLNWYMCGDMNTCLDPKTLAMAQASIQPLYLTCVDAAGLYCSVNSSYVYFALNYTTTMDDSIIMCFGMASNANGTLVDTGVATCTSQPPAYVTADITASFVPSGPIPATSDQCGFYFFPYDLLRDSEAKFGGFFVTNFDLKFDSDSYAKNNPSLDYTLVQKSTFQQNVFSFPEPYPNYQ